MPAPALNRKFWGFGFGNDESSFTWDLVDWAALAAGTSLPAPLPTAIPLAGASGLGAAAIGWDQIFGSSDTFVFPDGIVVLPGGKLDILAANAGRDLPWAPDVPATPQTLSGADLVIFSDDHAASFDGAMFFTPAFDISTISAVVDSNNVRHDTVTNFRPGLTLLQLDDADFSSAAAVLANAKQVGSDTVITVDSSYEIILKSVALASLDAGSFLLI